jgi:hypothetical protein
MLLLFVFQLMQEKNLRLEMKLVDDLVTNHSVLFKVSNIVEDLVTNHSVLLKVSNIVEDLVTNQCSV